MAVNPKAGAHVVQIYPSIDAIDASRADRRVEIQSNPKLKWTLEEWESNLKKALLRIEFKRNRGITAKNELYQLIGFYSVFQGVVLTAVAQASALTCQTSWGPASLSLLTSLAAAISVHSKLVSYEILRTKLDEAVQDSDVTNEKIRMLKRDGAKFDFAVLARVVEKAEKEKSAKRREREAESRRRYYWAVMLFLSLFSLIIFACCIFILCWENKQLYMF